MKNINELAKEAYIYGFAINFNLEQVKRYVEEGVGANKKTPFNNFSHAKTLATYEDTFVTINNDTVYSFAQIDLSGGPVILEIPKTDDRYYVLQFIDAWTNNFAYIGKRSIGENGGKFILTPPNYDGELLDGYQRIHCPTNVFTIAGRWACSSDDDLKNIDQLQQKVKLYQLHEHQVEGLPKLDAGVDADLKFWEQLRVNMQSFKPANYLLDYQEKFAPLGLLSEESLYVNCDKELKELLINAEKEGFAFLQNHLRTSKTVKYVNGWQLTYHVFDYNTDFFEIGTINSPEFVMPKKNEEDIKRMALERTSGAMGGLWGNQAYEACYLAIYTDSDNQQLNGKNKYKLHLNPTPPNKAFWSLTMYDVPKFLLVKNEISRYSIGDRTPGVIYEEDGSLILTISNEKPIDAKELANWLPAPSGDFRPVLRVYLPDADVYQERYVFPPIYKV